jgi:hypothetical protein
VAKNNMAKKLCRDPILYVMLLLLSLVLMGGGITGMFSTPYVLEFGIVLAIGFSSTLSLVLIGFAHCVGACVSK